MARTPVEPTLMLVTGLTFFILQGDLATVNQSEAKPGVLRHLWKRESSKESSSHGLTVMLESGTPEAKSRSKRCTCYSYRDKECVYYCHLDVIWINTPERMVPYGMSSYRGGHRLRRAPVGGPSGEPDITKLQRRDGTMPWRCTCTGPRADLGCRYFCQSRPIRSVPNRPSPSALGPT